LGKEEVERCHIERLRKKQKKTITVKRQVLQETSLDETSDESVIYGDDSDLDVSDDFCTMLKKVIALLT
jgi:hypothetical protein